MPTAVYDQKTPQQHIAMKKLQWPIIALFLFTSCDPVVVLEADIENLRSQDLLVEFVSAKQNLGLTLEIPALETRRFQAYSEIGIALLEPSLAEFDSVVIRNQHHQILRIYRPTDRGRNIYTIQQDWSLGKPSQWLYRYGYGISNADLE